MEVVIACSLRKQETVLGRYYTSVVCVLSDGESQVCMEEVVKKGTRFCIVKIT